MYLLSTIWSSEKDWELQKYIGYTYILSTSLSILGSLSIILVVLWKRRVRQSKVFPIFNIAVADFLASCGLFGSTIVYEVHVRSYIEPAPDLHAHFQTSAFNETIRDCRLANGPVLCVYGITFLLTMAYAVYRYLILKQKLEQHATGATETTPLKGQNDDVRHPMTYIIYITAWLLPVLLAAIMAAIYETLIVKNQGLNSVYQDRLWCINGCLQIFSNGFQKCHSHVKTERWFIAYRLIFHGLLLVVTVSNMAIYYLIMRMSKICIAQEGRVGPDQRVRLKNTRNRVFWYQAVFLFCWTPSLILAVMSTVEWAQDTQLYNFHNPETPHYYFVLYYIQAATAPLQGFLNAIIYGWTNEKFRSILRLPRGDSGSRNGACD